MAGLSCSEWCSQEADAFQSAQKPLWELAPLGCAGACFFLAPEWDCELWLKIFTDFKQKRTFVRRLLGRQQSASFCRVGVCQCVVPVRSSPKASITHGMGEFGREGAKMESFGREKSVFFQAEGDFFFLSSQGGHEWVSRTSTLLTSQLVDTSLRESDVHYFKASCLHLYIVRQWPSLCGRMN